MKKKLTIDEQIANLKEKGVTFNIMNEDEAKKFLRYNNYYFKLKSYASNYPVNPKNNKYVNLDFAYLVELSRIDMYFRKIILGMCLDVEHVLKTRMLTYFFFCFCQCICQLIGLSKFFLALRFHNRAK